MSTRRATQVGLASPAVIRRFVSLAITVAALGAILLVSAGRADWSAAWAYLGLSAAMLAVNGVVLMRRNPEVVAARGEAGAGTATFDRVFAALYTPLLVAMLVVAGLDAGRFGWATLGPPVGVAGAALFLLSDVPILWSLAVNPFLERTVRIQAERDHRTITVGPYRIVRHPMYVGMIVQDLATPLLLGSAWALVPAAGLIVLLVVRTALEDRTLTAALPGYAEFTQHTRYRLVPGAW